MYWWKPAVRVLKLVPSKWKKELAEAKAKNAQDIEALQKEIDEVKSDNETLEKESKSELESLKAELDQAREEIVSARAKAAESVAEAKQDLVEYKFAQNEQERKWKMLNGELRSDVDNLRTMLQKHERDDVRSVVLWPSGCGYGCVENYSVVYGIWSKLAARLEDRFAVEWAKLPCSKRSRLMRYRFLKWCQPYPEPVRVRLLGYYDYLVAGRVCSW